MRYEMSQLVRVFALKELHSWNHETALVEYLQQTHHYVVDSASIPYPISQSCGGVGTTGSPLISGRPLRRPRGQS